MLTLQLFSPIKLNSTKLIHIEHKLNFGIIIQTTQQQKHKGTKNDLQPRPTRPNAQCTYISVEMSKTPNLNT